MQARKESRAGKKYVFKTNHTLSNDKREYMLLDSGFSGYAVVGSNTLTKHKDKFFIAKVVGTSTKSSYTFGAGDVYYPIQTVMMRHPKVKKLIKVDVVEGDLPFLLGRAFLRIHRGVLNFGDDTVSLDGKKCLWSGAHMIPLSSLADEVQRSKYVAAHPCTTDRQVSQSSETRADCSVANLASTDNGASQSNRGKPSMAEEELAGHRCGGDDCADRSKRKTKIPFEGRHDCASCD